MVIQKHISAMHVSTTVCQKYLYVSLGSSTTFLKDSFKEAYRKRYITQYKAGWYNIHHLAKWQPLSTKVCNCLERRPPQLNPCQQCELSTHKILSENMFCELSPVLLLGIATFCVIFLIASVLTCTVVFTRNLNLIDAWLDKFEFSRHRLLRKYP